MDSVNKFLTRVILPAIILIYALFIIYSFLLKEQSFFVERQANKAQGYEEISGLIIGGSNALYSLSAEILSERTGSAWLNLALLDEGYSEANYFMFLRSALPLEKREEIRHVVYSSVIPLRNHAIYIREISKKNIVGKEQIKGNNNRLLKILLPEKNIISFLYALKKYPSLLLNINNFPTTKFGDLDFSKKECELLPYHVKFERNLERYEVEDWAIGQQKALRSLYPNAQIYFVVPSEFYGEHLKEEESIKSDEILSNAVFLYNKAQDDNVKFIRQNFFPSKKLLCDRLDHANNLGRLWRTTELLRHINKW